MSTTEKTFDLSALIGDDAYPFEHEFTEGALAGLSIRYRTLPTDVMQILAEALKPELSKRGLDPLVAAVAFVGRKDDLREDERRDAEETFAALGIQDKIAVNRAVSDASGAIIANFIGSTNANMTFDAATCARLDKGVQKLLFELAGNASLVPSAVEGAPTEAGE